MEVFKGIPVSPGVAIGRVLVLDGRRERIPRRTVDSDEVDAELARLDEALAASRDELLDLESRANERLGDEAAKIFAFHRGMLADPSLTGPLKERVKRERVTAEYAVAESFAELAQWFRSLDDPSFNAKVDDVWDLERRVVRRLTGETKTRLARLSEPAVVIGHELTPSEAASFTTDTVMAFVTDIGGRTSHTAIIAHSIGIPAVVGAGRLTESAQDGDLIIVDGDRGVVVLNPDESTIAEHERYVARQLDFRRSLVDLSGEEAVTLDGEHITLMGNIEFPREAATVIQNGGEGVGLYRTEFLFLTHDDEPSEEVQYENYAEAVRLMEGRPITFRTFDLGADKYTSRQARDPERNPFLGLRSIRYCLQNLPMFRRQLRAILRASTLGPVRVMFPLITTLTELRQAKMVLRDVMEDLEDEGVEFDRGVKIGMMVESPAAAVMASAFAREVDFFSIGTNDLVQYVLAVDRTNEHVASLYTPTHPAVIRLLKDVIRAARRAEAEVSICGEIAGDVEYTMLLLGMGLRTLSASPQSLPRLKRVIRSVDIPTCERLARKVGSLDSERLIAMQLRDAARKVIPEAFDGRSVED
jgi:phosphotransferase system enzyme I (PtsI)